MKYHNNCQSAGDVSWAEFAAELATVTPSPVCGAALAALEAIDAIGADVDPIDELERELAAFESLDPSERPAHAPAPRHVALFERLEASSKIASNPIGKIASKSEGPKEAESVAAHSFVQPVKEHLSRVPFSPPLIPPITTLHRHPLSTPVSASPLPPKTWKEASAADKLKASIALVGQKRGLTFSLNLSPEQEKAMRASADPARHISDRINRQLKAAGVPSPEYGFVLEISPQGRLHLHGVLSPGLHDITAIKQALVRAGGKIKGKAGSTQLLIEPILGASIWSRYVTKDMAKTKHDLGLEKLTYISTPLRRLCRDVETVEGKPLD